MQKKYDCSSVTERTSVADMADILKNGPPGPWPAGWAAWDNTRLAHIRLMYGCMEETPEYPEGQWSGRGIVISVNAKPGHSSGKYLAHGYFPGAWVVVKELRRLGCTLPIVFAHLGAQEWDANLTKLVEPLGVTILDLSKPDPYWKPMRILAGWESKIDAICRCPFEEVIYLDADCIPLKDPSYLFDWSQLKYYGCILWPDVPPQDRAIWLPKEVWANIDMEDNSGITDAESGQLVIHKKLWWKELNLCRWFNEHSDWFFRFVFGDKSTFLLSPMRVHANDPANTFARYFMIPHGVGGNHASLIHYDPARSPLFQHLTRNKPNIDGFPHPNALLMKQHAYDHLAELRSIWHGRLWFNSKPNSEEFDAISRLVSYDWTYERGGVGGDPEKTDSRQMSFFFRSSSNGNLPVYRVGEGLAKCEVGWSVLTSDGSLTLAIHNIDGAPVMFLKMSDPDTWEGRWVIHERCKVTLRRS